MFVLQVRGRKRWIIHAPVLASPLPQQPWPERRAEVEAAAAGAPYLEAVLNPGDALYFPRGWLHAADALDEATVHLTVGIHVWTRRHIVERVLSSAGEAESLRTSLPLGVDFTDPTSFADDLRAASPSSTKSRMRPGSKGPRRCLVGTRGPQLALNRSRR
jgi:ribosomal protein L16 Arg81 hydroxylase